MNKFDRKFTRLISDGDGVPEGFEERMEARLSRLPPREARDRSGGRVWRRGRPAFAVLAAVLAVCLITGTALAASGFRDFFKGVFGPKGQEDRESGRGELIQGTDILPGQIYDDPDIQAVEDALDGYVTQIDASVSLNGCTLTVESLIIDENGAGAVAYRVEDPRGVSGIEMEEDIYPAGQYKSPDFRVELRAASGVMTYEADILDLDSVTDTSLRGVIYFMFFAQEPGGTLPEDALSIGLAAVDGEGRTVRSDAVELRAGTLAPAAKLSCGDIAAAISPMSLIVDAPEGDPFFWYDALSGGSETVIRYADGGEYLIAQSGGDSAWQNYLLYGSNGYTGQRQGIFNRFVDVENVESLTLTASDGTQYTFTPVK